MKISYEFFPPKTDEQRAQLDRTAAALKMHDPEFASVTFGAGGSTDITARLLAEKMRPILGQPAVVENRPGAGTLIAAQAGAAPGDRLRAIADALGPELRDDLTLLVIDDAAWIGGINFSDHNFAWHDMMVRIADPAVADWLASEFERDWSGTTGNAAATIGEVELLSLDGSANEAGFAPVLELIGQARQSIEVVSAYPTFPFVDALAAAAKRGLAVQLYTPRPNNKPVIRDYLLGVAAKSGLDVQLTPMMTHAKAMLVDGAALVLGSSNFDFVSHRSNAEYVATVRDAGLISDFTARVLVPLREGASAPQPGDLSAWRSRKAEICLRVADVLVSFLDHGPRVAEWQRT